MINKIISIIPGNDPETRVKIWRATIFLQHKYNYNIHFIFNLNFFPNISINN